MSVTTLTSKGQIVIPQEIREQLDLKQGDKLNISLNQGKIIMEVIDHTAKLNSFRSKVRAHLQSNQIGSITDEQINQAKSGLWSQRQN